MAQEGQIAALRSLLSNYHAFITYRPLRTEASVLDLLSLPEGCRVFEIPPRASLDPLQEARSAVEFAAGADVAVILPGRRFDASGTRHGQGGGWYDRFLAAVPREWLRIGVCYDDQFSPAPLLRASWDQAMDYVVVIDRRTGTGTVYSSEGEPS